MEVLARTIRRKIKTAPDEISTTETFNQYVSKMRNAASRKSRQMQVETKNGTLPSEVMRWSDGIASELDALTAFIFDTTR